MFTRKNDREVCDKKFADSSQLRIHMRVHTRERRFICKECDKKFPSLSDLIRHCTLTRENDLLAVKFVIKSLQIRHT